MAIAAGRPLSRLALLSAVLEEFEAIYQLTVEKGFTAVLELWRSGSVTLGRMVDVFGVGRKFSGIALDIADDGALLVETAGGLERVVAGDVSIRAREGEG